MLAKTLLATLLVVLPAFTLAAPAGGNGMRLVARQDANSESSTDPASNGGDDISYLPTNTTSSSFDPSTDDGAIDTTSNGASAAAVDPNSSNSTLADTSSTGNATDIADLNGTFDPSSFLNGYSDQAAATGTA